MPSIFCHFELYYSIWYKSFTKPSDPLVLFYHWCMIQNRFKCSFESELTELLPNNWNSSSNYYDLNYKKHDIAYRLEIYITNDILFAQLRNLTNFMDSTQYIKVNDFINKDDYKNAKFELVFKDLEELHMRLKWSIDHFKTKKVLELLNKSTNSSKTIQSNTENTTKDTEKAHSETDIGSCAETESIETAISTTTTASTSTLENSKHRRKTKEISSALKSAEQISYNQILNQIKQEKQEFDKSIEMNKFNSISSSKSVTSTSSSSNLSENLNTKKKSNSKTRGSLPQNKKDDFTDLVPNDQLTNKHNEMDTNDQHIESGLNQIETIPTLEQIQNLEETSNKNQNQAIELSELNLESQKTKNRITNKDKCRINRSDLYDFNPITNYFFYNRKTDQKKIDEKLIEDDDFINNSFKKFNLKICEIKLIDCFKTKMFKDQKLPIKLTNEMKTNLNLNPIKKSDYSFLSSSDGENIDKNSDHLKSTKYAKKKQNIWRTKRRTKTKFSRKNVSTIENSMNKEENKSFVKNEVKSISSETSLNITEDSCSITESNSTDSKLKYNESSLNNQDKTIHDEHLNKTIHIDTENEEQIHEKSFNKNKESNKSINSIYNYILKQTKCNKRKRPSNDSDYLPKLDFLSPDIEENKNNTNNSILIPLNEVYNSIDETINKIVKEVHADTVFKRLNFSTISKSSITIEHIGRKSLSKNETVAKNLFPIDDKDKENDEDSLSDSRPSKKFKKQINNYSETDSDCISEVCWNKSPNKIFKKNDLISSCNSPTKNLSHHGSPKNTPKIKQNKLKELANFTLESFSNLISSPKYLLNNLKDSLNNSGYLEHEEKTISNKKIDIVNNLLSEDSSDDECLIVEPFEDKRDINQPNNLKRINQKQLIKKENEFI